MTTTRLHSVKIVESGPLFQTGRDAACSQWLLYAVNFCKPRADVLHSIHDLQAALLAAKSGIVIHRFDRDGRLVETQLDEHVQFLNPSDVSVVRERIMTIVSGIDGMTFQSIEVLPFSVEKDDVTYSLSADTRGNMVLEPGHYFIELDGQAMCASQ
jgi:hypothetical protein